MKIPFPPPPPKLEGYPQCSNCLKDDVYKADLVCRHCGYTLRIPLYGWIGGALMVFSMVPLFLWMFGITQINILPFIGQFLPELPFDTFALLGIVLFLAGLGLGFTAAGRIRSESERYTTA